MAINRLTLAQIIAHLGLKPHLEEGGFYREIYRSTEIMPQSVLPPRYAGDRCFGTAIYYLVTPASFSALHRLTSDEIFHFYLGDPVEMLQLRPDGTGERYVLGPDLLTGMQLQIAVLRDFWQGFRLLSGGEYALIGTTVTPGFEFADFEFGQREALLKAYPRFQEMICGLTR